MRNLLLVSSSRVHGSGYLEHCSAAMADHFADADSVLFVPYALADHDKYESTVSTAFEAAGLKLQSIHHANDPIAAIDSAAGIFVGGGNSFRLLKTLYDLKLVNPIRERVMGGMPYMGSSAGTNMSCPTIRTTNDMPIVEPPSFNALNLIPFQINPHYLDPDPNSTHKGETREQRITEFHEENDIPVAGIREGNWFKVTGDSIQLHGHTGMRLFQKDKPPQEFSAGDDIQVLMG